MEWSAVGALAAFAAIPSGIVGVMVRRCQQKMDSFDDALSSHKLEDASAFAELRVRVAESRLAQTAIEERLVKAIDGLNERFDRFTERLDRLLEERPPHGSR